MRVHNYGEPFIDRQLVEKVRYAKQKGIKEVGMISNGSLITEDVARGMIEAGLDAINISVDAVGQGSLRVDAPRPQLRQGHRQHRAARAASARELGKRRPKLILSFVRQNNSRRRAGVHRALAQAIADKIHITDLHNWAGTLNHESDVNYPCYRPWLTFTVLWDGRVSLCCADFDGRTVLGDLNTSTIQEIWNAEPYRARPPRAPRERRPGHLPLLRPAPEGLAALGDEARPEFLRLSSRQLESVLRQRAYTGWIRLEPSHEEARSRRALAAALFVSAAMPRRRRRAALTMANGRVTLVAQDVTVREILAEWARVGQARSSTAKSSSGTPVTLELTDVPEAQALDTVLRSAAGYVMVPRVAGSAGASRLRPDHDPARRAARRRDDRDGATVQRPTPQTQQVQQQMISADDDDETPTPNQQQPMPGTHVPASERAGDARTTADAHSAGPADIRRR